MGRFTRKTWGWYFVLCDRDHFKIKILRFKHSHPLSRQYHNLRNELWLVLSGGGIMTVDGNRKSLLEGNWVVIGKNIMHTFTALYKTYILEIQYGESCKEEDIIRL